MSGPLPTKKKIPAVVYIHEKDDYARVVHIDVESPVLAEIIKPGEKTFVGGKHGGIFIALKKDMINRAEKVLKK